jgi:hypothetical protein
LHAVLLLAIVVGFFHGWLKLRYRSPVTTFAFDALLSLAIVMCITSLPRGATFFPKSPITKAISAFYVIVALWSLVPSDMPLLVRLASLRGWCFPPLVFGLGYHMTRSVDQVKGFFLVLIILGVTTGIYGIQQSPEEIKRMMQEDEYVAVARLGSGYATETGKAAIRRFSTFVSAGVFGGVMAFVSGIALVLFADAGTRNMQRALLGGALLVMSYGIVLSGSRSPAVNLGLAVGLIAITRRNLMVPLVVAVVAFLTLSWVSDQTGGAVMERYATLADRGILGSRYLIPVQSALGRLGESWIGTGLGTSSYSVPMFLFLAMPAGVFRGAEGDLSCLAVEMGLVGILGFGRILWLISKSTYEVLRSSSGKAHGVVALAAATAVAPTVLNFPVGAPFLGIPTGALTWFFIGCMVKLNEMGEALPTEKPSESVPVTGAPAKRFLYWQPPR